MKPQELSIGNKDMSKYRITHSTDRFGDTLWAVEVYQPDVNTVRSVKDELLEYCNNLIPQGREKLKLTNKEVDIERPLRWNLDKPCLRKVWYRLWRICSHTGYEFYKTNFSNDVINALEKSMAQVGERKEYESKFIKQLHTQPRLSSDGRGIFFVCN